MCSGEPEKWSINGKDEYVGQQSADDAAWIRSQNAGGKWNVRAGDNSIVYDNINNAVLGEQSIAPPKAPDLTDTLVQSAKQQQLLSGLASTGYMATFLGK